MDADLYNAYSAMLDYYGDNIENGRQVYEFLTFYNEDYYLWYKDGPSFDYYAAKASLFTYLIETYGENEVLDYLLGTAGHRLIEFDGKTQSQIISEWIAHTEAKFNDFE